MSMFFNANTPSLQKLSQTPSRLASQRVPPSTTAHFAAAMERLRTLTRHLGAAHAASYEHNNDPYTQPVEEALRRLPGGDGPGDPGIPEALDPDAPMSVFLLMGQSSMAGRGMLPEFQTPIPDILSFHYEYDEWDVAVEPLCRHSQTFRSFQPWSPA